MNDSVAQLRSRWTPELTDAAIRFLQGNPTEIEIPTMELDGETYLDLRGIRIEQTQLDGMLIRNVNLRWSTNRDVGLKDAKFVNCNLSQAGFSECYFRRTVFQNCDIVNAKFDSSDFSNARIDASRIDFATFRNCEITLRNIRFRQDTNPQVLARVCRNLKLNAMSMGHFDDASDLAYMEKSYERHVLFNQAFAQKTDRVGKRLKAIAFWLDAVILNWLWGYGERPWRLMLAMVATIVAFGTVQFWLDAIPDKSWWAHVYFSGITFLTVGYGDLVPIEAIPRLVAVVEGMVGIMFIGLLIASATKKIMYR
ncbi:MAG: pentapeptide repeat-containing protein [Betaproteobacteria bacterium]|nr:pentapeptide repeat-containing protein [Betaproteobacteria bacterium]